MLVTDQMQGDSEELLRSFIDQAPVPIAMFDREMRYIAASRRWVSDYGFNDKSWRGASHYEMFPDLPSRWLAIHRRALYGEACSSSAKSWSSACANAPRASRRPSTGCAPRSPRPTGFAWNCANKLFAIRSPVFSIAASSKSR